MAGRGRRLGPAGYAKMPQDTRVTVPEAEIRPNRSLVLLAVAHAVNHAQGVVLPLIFLKIIDEFGVGVETVAFLAAIGAFASGVVQLTYAGLTRVMSRRSILG